MQTDKNSYRTRINRTHHKQSRDDDNFEEIRNAGKLMCRICKKTNAIEIVKEKDRVTLITFLPDRIQIENRNNCTD